LNPRPKTPSILAKSLASKQRPSRLEPRTSSVSTYHAYKKRRTYTVSSILSTRALPVSQVEITGRKCRFHSVWARLTSALPVNTVSGNGIADSKLSVLLVSRFLPASKVCLWCGSQHRPKHFNEGTYTVVTHCDRDLRDRFPLCQHLKGGKQPRLLSPTAK